MNLMVCIKQVPVTTEVDLRIEEEGTSVATEGLVHVINEWDLYAVEEAVRWKERLGGRITVLTLGPASAGDAIRRCLAMGADEAVHIQPPGEHPLDAHQTARILEKTIRDRPFDLILTGAQASDDGLGQTGVLLAGMLGIPYTTLALSLKLDQETATVSRELENGWEEQVSLRLPALITIQSGINEPRYVSIMGIRRARKKPVLDTDPLSLGFSSLPEPYGRIRRFSLPVSDRRAEIIEGPADTAASKLTDILRKKGVL